MAVPYTFGTATAAIPLSQLDSNFATTITLGNTAIQLGNTVTTLNNMTLANVTVSSGNVTFTNVSATTANVTTGNVATLVTTSVTNSGLTTGRVVYASTGGLLTSSANLLYSGTDLTVYGLTVGRGASAVADNTAIGVSALAAITSGASTTAVGYQAGFSTTTGSNNTVLGYQALYSNITTSNNTAIGYQAGYSAIGLSSTASDNTFIGSRAGTLVTTARKNTFIGNTIGGLGGSGSAVTTGNNNVIIGAYTGAAAPISATGSNYIVLSDGDGNIRQTIDSSGNVGIGTTSPVSKLHAYGTGQIGTIESSGDYSSSGSGFIRYKDSTGNRGYVGFGGTSNLMTISNALTSGVINFETNGSERMRIDSSGNMQVSTGAVMPYAPAPAAISAAATLTNANIQGQIISATGTTYTITMPLGTTLDTLASWTAVNIGYDFFVINTASGIITMAVNTGVTSLGSLTIAIGASAHFRIRRTAASTYVLYRLV